MEVLLLQRFLFCGLVSGIDVIVVFAQRARVQCYELLNVLHLARNYEAKILL